MLRAISVPAFARLWVLVSMFTAAQRWRQPRCWLPSTAVRLVAHTGCSESRPGWGCASSVGCMRCSAAAEQGAHARMSRGLTGLTGRGWSRRRAAPACQRRGLGGTPPQATQCSWCPHPPARGGPPNARLYRRRWQLSEATRRAGTEPLQKVAPRSGPRQRRPCTRRCSVPITVV
jgi:hypothetical protein